MVFHKMDLLQKLNGKNIKLYIACILTHLFFSRPLDTSDCPICFEEFEEDKVDQIDFCKMCGNNIHKVYNQNNVLHNSYIYVLIYRNALACGLLQRVPMSLVSIVDPNGLLLNHPLDPRRRLELIWAQVICWKETMQTLLKNLDLQQREIHQLIGEVIEMKTILMMIMNRPFRC